VAFSPERMRRPIHCVVPELEKPDPSSDPFLEGNEAHTPPEVLAYRPAGGTANGPGWKVRVVPNRFPALRVEGDLNKEGVGFYDRMNGIGAHEVIIETPDATAALEDLALADVVLVLKALRSRMQDLAKDSRFKYLLFFKNSGSMAGASLPHAHSQLIALPVTPILLKDKLAAAERHFLQKERNLFEDILRYELKSRERVVSENAGYVTWCPFASRFPFETCLMPKRQAADFPQSSDHDLVLLADALRRILLAYQKGLARPAFNIVLHTAPLRVPRKDYWKTIDADFRWHMEIMPRLTGLAGFELGTGFYMNSILPEDAAEFLRKVRTDA